MANDMLQYPSHLIADGVTLLLQLNGRQHQCLWLQVAGDYHLADVLLFFVAESCSIHPIYSVKLSTLVLCSMMLLFEKFCKVICYHPLC